MWIVGYAWVWSCTPVMQVEVLWVVSQRQTKWEAALPKETADVLNSGRAGSSGRLDRLKNAVTGLLSDRLGTRKAFIHTCLHVQSIVKITGSCSHVGLHVWVS